MTISTGNKWSSHAQHPKINTSYIQPFHETPLVPPVDFHHAFLKRALSHREGTLCSHWYSNHNNDVRLM